MVGPARGVLSILLQLPPWGGVSTPRGVPRGPSGPPPGADEDTGDEVISNEEAIAEVEGVTMNAADEGTE